MKKINMLKNRLTVFLSVFVFAIFGLGGVLIAQSVNQGYTADEVLQKGMLVVVTDQDQTKVAKANKDNLEKLKGVIVQQNDSPVTLAGAGQNVFVATNGIYDVLVSTENGPIKNGDYLSISSLEGIGMKATDEQLIVLGRASQDFGGGGQSIGRYQDPNTGQSVEFGRIQANISVNRNPWLREDLGNRIPKLIERISVAVAGKQVPTARIWIATAVFLGTIFVVGVMLYSGARSSLISVGRNPLSKGAILRGLLQVVILSVTVFITGLFGVYLLLKL